MANVNVYLFGAAERLIARFTKRAETAATAAEGTLGDVNDAVGLVTGMLNLKPDVSTGLAETSDDEFFTVPGPGATYATLYQNQSGVAVAINAYPSKQAMDVAVTAAAASAAAAQGYADAAAAVSATTGVYPVAAASNVPRGLTQASVGAITPGSGGSNGTFPLGWAGGNFLINPTGTFTVAGGVVVPGSVMITGPGLYIGASPIVPTPSFSASSGLTGAGVALTAQFLVTSGQGYWSQSSDGQQLNRINNVGGVATAASGVGPINLGTGITKQFQQNLVLYTEAPNLFDPTTVVSDYIIRATDGVAVSNGAFDSTGYLPVTGGGNVVSDVVIGYSTPYGIAFYTEALTFISGVIGPIAAGTPTAVPASAKYMRTSWLGSVRTSSVHIYATTALPATPKDFGFIDPNALENGLRAHADAANAKWVNLYDYNEATQSFIVNVGTGALVDFANPAYFMTALMPCTPGGYVITNFDQPVGYGVTYGGIAWYDRKGVYLSGTTGELDGGVGYLVPANAYFWRINGQDTSVPYGNLRRLYCGTGTTLPPNNFIDAGQNGVGKMKRWRGGKLVIIGDSIISQSGFNYGQHWVPHLTSYLDVASFVNKAHDGDRLQNILSRVSSSDFTDATLALCHVGTNDHSGFGSQTPLGTLADTSAAATVAGRMRLIEETIHGWNANVRLAFTAPLHKVGGDVSSGSYPVILKDYADFMIEVARRIGVPIYDFYGRSGWTDTTLSTLTGDGIHPNAAGGAVLWPQTGKWLETL